MKIFFYKLFIYIVNGKAQDCMLNAKDSEKKKKKQTALLSNANSCGVGNSWVAQHLPYR